MLLKSEIGRRVSGGSTDFTNYYHVDDENSHRHEYQEQDNIDVHKNFNNTKQAPLPDDEVDRSVTHHKNCESSHDFLRSGCCAQVDCLNTKH